MSLYIAVELNDKTKKLLYEKQVYLKQHSVGEFEDPSKFHITVEFLSKDQVDNDLAIQALKLFKDTYNPKSFTLEARNFYKFEKGVMWIGVHNSIPLYDIKYQIKDCLNKVKFPLMKDRFKGYTPHITMGYNVKEEDTLIKEFEGIPIEINNICLWNGFKSNDTYIHNYIYRVDF